MVKASANMLYLSPYQPEGVNLATVFLWLRASSLLGSLRVWLDFLLPLCQQRHSMVKASANMLCHLTSQKMATHYSLSVTQSSLLGSEPDFPMPLSAPRAWSRPQPTCSVSLPARRGPLASVFMCLRASSFRGSLRVLLDFLLPLCQPRHSMVKASANTCLSPYQPEGGNSLQSFCGSELVPYGAHSESGWTFCCLCVSA